MLQQIVTVGSLAAASANNIVTAITPTSGTALTLNGSTVSGGVATLDVPRRVLLTFGNEGSARTLVLTGTNATGNPIQETLAVAAGAPGTVATIQDFATVIRALPAGSGWTAAITIGTNGTASSPWIFVDLHFGPTNIGIGGVTTGTVTWGVEYTYDNPNNNQNTLGGALGNYPTPPIRFNHPVLNALATNGDSVFNDTIYAWRAAVTAGTGSVKVTGIQSGIVN